jgi:endonuclease/exonuclease/phosphatase family metal-dependent hydrolase
MTSGPQEPAASLSETVQVLTYNIHGSVGRDGRCEPERILAVIRDVGATIIGLQEVDNRHPGPQGLDQFEYFAEGLRMRCIPGPNIVDHRGQYGNVLLTSWPVESSRLVRLTVGRREPRGAICAVLRCGRARLQVVNTHLGLRPDERREQARRLLRAAAGHDGPTLFLGDFNVWRRRSTALGSLGAPASVGYAPRTYPATRPLLALDRIWTTPLDLLESVRVINTPTTSLASDHLPLHAAIRT